MAEIIQLEGNANRWSFSSLGGRIVGWEGLDGEVWRAICRGDGQKKPSEDSHRACIMFPWVNRIGGDHWLLEGERVPIDTTRERGNLHGRVVDAEWDVAEGDATKVVFHYRLEASEYYPTASECTVTYAIGELDEAESLDISIVSKNLSNRVSYVTTGFHPYFLNPWGGKVDEMELFVDALQEYEVDEELIPTGLIDVTDRFDFRRSRLIGDTSLDNGFTLQPEVRPVATLRYKNFRLAIQPGEFCGTMQVYIPAHREEIALEPQSGGADAFRWNRFGLRRLFPNESFKYSVQFSATFDRAGALDRSP